jgi:hypothetical protein
LYSLPKASTRATRLRGVKRLAAARAAFRSSSRRRATSAITPTHPLRSAQSQDRLAKLTRAKTIKAPVLTSRIVLTPCAVDQKATTRIILVARAAEEADTATDREPGVHVRNASAQTARRSRKDAQAVGAASSSRRSDWSPRQVVSCGRLSWGCVTVVPIRMRVR